MFSTLISLFKENEKLGLIGVAGAQFLPNNGYGGKEKFSRESD